MLVNKWKDEYGRNFAFARYFKTEWINSQHFRWFEGKIFLSKFILIKNFRSFSVSKHKQFVGELKQANQTISYFP